jgi:hypothetical protein
MKTLRLIDSLVEVQAHYVVRSFSVPLAPGADLAKVNQ